MSACCGRIVRCYLLVCRCAANDRGRLKAPPVPPCRLRSDRVHRAVRDSWSRHRRRVRHPHVHTERLSPVRRTVRNCERRVVDCAGVRFRAYRRRVRYAVRRATLHAANREPILVSAARELFERKVARQVVPRGAVARAIGIVIVRAVQQVRRKENDRARGANHVHRV